MLSFLFQGAVQIIFRGSEAEKIGNIFGARHRHCYNSNYNYYSIIIPILFLAKDEEEYIERFANPFPAAVKGQCSLLVLNLSFFDQ